MSDKEAYCVLFKAVESLHDHAKELFRTLIETLNISDPETFARIMEETDD